MAFDGCIHCRSRLTAGFAHGRVVLGNGEEFVLQASACFDAGAAPDGEQKLSNRGLRALDDSTDGRCFQ